MKKYIWLIVLAVPPLVAMELGASKWLIIVLFAIFAFYASTINPRFKKSENKEISPFVILFIMAGLVMGAVLFQWMGALMR